MAWGMRGYGRCAFPDLGRLIGQHLPSISSRTLSVWGGAQPPLAVVTDSGGRACPPVLLQKNLQAALRDFAVSSSLAQGQA